MFSFGSSVFKLFEEPTLFVKGVPEKDFIMAYYHYKAFWITVIRTVHYVINDFVIFLVNFVVDLVLVFKVRKDLAQKKKLTKKLAGTSSGANHKKIDEIKKAQDDTSKLIIFTFFLLVVCRLPELAFELHFLFFQYNYDFNSYYYICITSGFCTTLKDTAHFFYIGTYCANIFIYYQFNKNFKQALRDFFKMEKKPH